MTQQIIIFGYGPVGRAAVAQLAQSGSSHLIVAQRSEPAELPAGVGFVACDILDAAAVHAVVAGASQVVLAVGFDYTVKVWRDAWPRAMANVLAACAAASARLVFVDNLYMYGPQTEPLHEDMPLVYSGGKPGVRADITRQWQAEAMAGRVKVAAVRGPDFYGPGVRQSHLGDVGFARIGAGKPAFLVAAPDTVHDFAYVPDFGRAVVTLLQAPDDCFNQAWHVPCAPIQTPRAILQFGATALGQSARVSSLPLWTLRPLGLLVPFLRELDEMRFQWDRPYRVDTRKFAQRFWSDATPFAVGAAETARSFKTAKP